MEKVKRVDFIGVAAQRSGTTWISKCLAEHPEICFSKSKETHFFETDHNYNQGLDFYMTQFSHCSDEKILGEFTPTYYLHPKAAERIRESFPEVKILIFLRNPMERAFSNYVYRKHRIGMPRRFEEAWHNKKYETMISNGFYHKKLTEFLSSFSNNKIHITILEQSKKDPEKSVKEIYEFLEVDSSFMPSSLRVDINKSKDQKYYLPIIEWIISCRHYIKRSSAGLFVIKILKSVGVNSMIGWIQGVNKKRDNEDRNIEELITVEDKKFLYDKFYKTDIEKLEKKFNLDLNIWKPNQ